MRQWDNLRSTDLYSFSSHFSVQMIEPWTSEETSDWGSTIAHSKFTFNKSAMIICKLRIQSLERFKYLRTTAFTGNDGNSRIFYESPRQYMSNTLSTNYLIIVCHVTFDMDTSGDKVSIYCFIYCCWFCPKKMWHTENIPNMLYPHHNKSLRVVPCITFWLTLLINFFCIRLNTFYYQMDII